MRNKLIAANWKMNFTVPEALKYFACLNYEMKSPPACEVVVCPPFTSLYAMEEVLKGSNYKLGAQNMHWEDQGAFTGEISPLFLRDVNVSYVILGHSERRQHFGETDAMINKKAAAAMKYQLRPIVCVGETAAQKKEEKTKEVIEGQAKKILDGQLKLDLDLIVWAYEPIWAIGTGNNALPEEAQAVASWMRKLFSKILDTPTAEKMRILYGGSVSEERAAAFLSQPDVDGLLVGGASLDPVRFADILRAAG